MSMDWRLGTRYDPELLAHVRLQPADTSYFATPREVSDPRLVLDGRLHPRVASWILLTLTDAFTNEPGMPVGPNDWLEVYVAGSALTSLWRDHGDLDVLLGVHWEPFFKANPTWRAKGRQGAGEAINAVLHSTIWRDDWHGPEGDWGHPVDVTFYVNHQHADIREMNPYAAWDVRRALWAVPPIQLPEDWDPDTAVHVTWRSAAEREIGEAEYLIERARGGDVAAATAAVEMWDRIHAERNEAFGRLGGGFNDYQTYRWQAHKRAGTSKALREIRKAVAQP